MKMLRFVGIALSGVFLLAGGPAEAANCGGATTCSCGDTVVANRTLDATDPVTTTLCPSRGLNVNDGITLGLGGRTIRAAAGNGDFGIAMGNNATVQGPGKVIGFGASGISNFFGHTGQRIFGVQSRKNGQNGITCVAGCNVRNNICAENGFHGIQADLSGTYYSNILNDNAFDGIVLFAGANGMLLQKNIAQRNSRFGIELFGGPTNNVLDMNELYSNVLGGILVTGSGHTLTANRLESNKGTGIHVDGDNNTLNNNLSKISGGSGILVTGGGNALRDNSGYQNVQHGIRVTRVGPGNIDNGKNTGTQNGGVQCEIDGQPCLP